MMNTKLPFVCGISLLLASSCVGEGTGPGWGVGENRVLEDPGATNDDEWSFSVAVPTGVARERLALAAASSLVLHPRVRVEAGPTDELPTVAGLRQVGIGEGCVLGTVYGGLDNSIRIGRETTIGGYVKASTDVVGAEAARIAIGVLDHVSDPGEYYEWHVEPPPATASTPLLVNMGLRDLAPGAYSSLVLEAEGSLSLRAGRYFFSKLELRSGTLSIDDSIGPVYVWVKDALAIRSQFRCPEHGKFLLGYSGTGRLSVAGGFCGLLIAPSATIALDDTSNKYSGSFFAEGIEVGEAVVVRHAPFSLW
jgi:hypothetical protein